MRPIAITTWKRWSSWAWIAAIASVYCGTAKLGLSMALVAEQVTAVWPPTGISLAVVLLLGHRAWPGIALGAFLANVTASETVLVACAIAAGNTLEAIAGAWFLQLAGFRRPLTRVRDVLALVALGAGLSTMLSATIGVLALCAGGVQPWSAWRSLWSVWWLGDATGALLIAPLVLSWATWRTLWPRQRLAEGLAVLSAVVLLSVVMFTRRDLMGISNEPLVYAMFPPMIWAALRLGQRGQTLVMFVAASCAIWGTYHGFGPFSQPSVHERLMLLQSFLAVLAVTGLVLAASASEGRRAERHRATSHAITQILGESKDLREVSRRVLPAIGETLEWDLGALWSLDREARVLRCVEAWHRPALSIGEFADVTRERTFPPGLGLPGRVWSSGRPHWIKDVVVDPNFPRASSADRAGLHAAFGFPIQLGGATLGVLEFFSRHVRDPDPELLDLVAGFGGQIGLFIERIRSEQLVGQSEARKSAILESALDGVITMNHEGRIVVINAAAEQMFGITKQAAVGALLAETIIPPSLRGAHRQGLEQFLATGDGPLIGKRMEVPAVRADGSEFPIEVSIIQVPGSEPPMFTGFLRDLTERKRAEQQREQLLERERLAREDSERANRMKDEFLANLSHELRTPLQSMLGWVHILRQGAADAPTAAHALATIERNARAQKQLIEDLLDMSGIISGKLQLDVQRVDLVPIIEAALVTARPAADAKQIRLERVLDPAAGAVLGDPNRLQQVLWNLLSNAIKFTPAKGRVTVVLERAGTQLRMIVSDTGEGIRRDFLPYVFDRFRQADASLTRRHGGLGLGLSIVRHLVELHGGTVEASSAGEGQGATFTLMLPSAPSTAREVLVNGPMRRAASSLERLKILLVDDEPDSRALIQHLLEQHGARVAVAGSGPDALAALERDPPDVLVSDLAMPHMDGYELIKRVRARPASRGGNTPAASLTAFARAEDRERAMRAGYQAHITKPVDAAELIAVIATLAGQSGSRPSTLVEC